MHLLFDLDGTIHDSQSGIVASLNHALEQLGRRAYPVEELVGYIGPPLQETMRTLLGEEGAEDVDRGIELYRTRYASHGLYDGNLYDGVAELLARLDDADHTLYVATSKSRLYAEPIIEHLGLRAHFRAIYGSEHDGTRSDKGELIAHILSEEGIDKEACVMIGDRSHDMRGATANKVKGIGVLWGYGSRAELLDSGCAHLCAAPCDLPALLDGL
jgi:phosphoglycolate phosphatase